ILAIDAGGTNLRFTLFENGQKKSEEKMPMLGVKQPITADQFFDEMATLISKYDCSEIGFCFSYPMEIMPNNDGKIMWLTKEVEITGSEGKCIGEEINKRLEKKRNFYFLNDTVACQLGVNADIGMILGTGFNMCFTDKALGMIINPELGQYGQLPQGTFDKMLDVEMNSPRLCSEKQISGVYLGKLIEICAREYFKKDIPSIELKDVSEFLIGEGPLYTYFTDSEKVEFREIIDLLTTRAAERVSTFVECLSGDSTDVTIGIEGSTIYKLPGYYDKVRRAIESIPGIYFTFKDARDTISIGAARATIK
ncbi:MAG: hypothetical protein Q4E99_00165, partial [Bacillota bacterium]|nr:hypothetical protein [Bacillota bacterium]